MSAVGPGHMVGWRQRKGRILSAERVEAHLPASNLSNLLSARWCGHRALRGKEVAMSTDSQPAKRALPEHPNLRHLKDQAKDLLKTGGAKSITDAQFQIARL